MPRFKQNLAFATGDGGNLGKFECWLRHQKVLDDVHVRKPVVTNLGVLQQQTLLGVLPGIGGFDEDNARFTVPCAKTNLRARMS